MMDIIREIEEKKRSVVVYTEGGERFWLTRSQLGERESLTAGQEIDVDELKQWLLPRQYPTALNDAVALLAQRAHASGEIAQKLLEVKARASAVKPDFAMDCKVILNKQELGELFGTIARELNFATVYAHAGVFQKGDDIQTAPTGDPITITMAGSVPGNIRSGHFDGDGMTLKDTVIVENGKAVAYYGDNRFGQYLKEQPTGNLRCIQVAPGSVCENCLTAAPYLEVLSMSGLQVDLFNDYIGGEVRLAYYRDGEAKIPVTGISITGSLKQVLSSIRLSGQIAVDDGYTGPAKAILRDMKIF